MDRRTFVSAMVPAAALLSGCIADGDQTDRPDNTSRPGPSTDATARADGPRFDLVESVPVQDLPLNPDVRVLQGDPHSRDSPVRLEVTLTNTADKALEFRERRSALFWDAISSDGLVLVPDHESNAGPRYEFDEEANGWVATERVMRTTDVQTGRLEPGESVSETLVVHTRYGAEPPEQPPERLSFDSRISVSTGGQVPVDGRSTWYGFTLALDDGGYVVERGLDRAFPLAYEVDLTRPEIGSPDGPVRVDVSLTNTSDRSIRYGERRAASFWWAGSGEFVLYPERAVTEDSYERDAETSRWVATEGHGMTMDYQTETLEPGETHTEPLLVLGAPGLDDPDPPVDVSTDPFFETTVSLLGDATGSMEWGFSLRRREE